MTTWEAAEVEQTAKRSTMIRFHIPPTAWIVRGQREPTGPTDTNDPAILHMTRGVLTETQARAIASALNNLEATQ